MTAGIWQSGYWLAGHTAWIRAVPRSQIVIGLVFGAGGYEQGEPSDVRCRAWDCPSIMAPKPSQVLVAQLVQEAVRRLTPRRCGGRSPLPNSPRCTAPPCTKNGSRAGALWSFRSSACRFKCNCCQARGRSLQHQHGQSGCRAGAISPVNFCWTLFVIVAHLL